MATEKKEFSSSDAEPVVIYGLVTANSEKAIPIICTTDGTLTITIV